MSWLITSGFVVGLAFGDTSPAIPRLELEVHSEEDCSWCDQKRRPLTAVDRELAANAESAVLGRIVGIGPPIFRGERLRGLGKPLYVLTNEAITLPNETVTGAFTRARALREIEDLALAQKRNLYYVRFSSPTAVGSSSRAHGVTFEYSWGIVVWEHVAKAKAHEPYFNDVPFGGRLRIWAERVDSRLVLYDSTYRITY